LIAHCRTSLAPYKVPKNISFLDALARSGMGKVLKTELVERLQTAAIDPSRLDHCSLTVIAALFPSLTRNRALQVSVL
jgi:hypothetical protein